MRFQQLVQNCGMIIYKKITIHIHIHTKSLIILFNIFQLYVPIVQSCFVSVVSILLCCLNYTGHLLMTWRNMCFSYVVFFSFVRNSFSLFLFFSWTHITTFLLFFFLLAHLDLLSLSSVLGLLRYSYLWKIQSSCLVLSMYFKKYLSFNYIFFQSRLIFNSLKKKEKERKKKEV